MTALRSVNIDSFSLYTQLYPSKSVFKEYSDCFSTVGNDFLENVTIIGSLLFKQSLCTTSSYCMN